MIFDNEIKECEKCSIIRKAYDLRSYLKDNKIELPKTLVKDLIEFLQKMKEAGYGTKNFERRLK